MRFGKTLMATAVAASIVTAPAIAQTAFPTTAGVERVGADSSDESELRGRGTGIIIGLLALAAVIGGIIIAVDDNDDGPTSP